MDGDDDDELPTPLTPDPLTPTTPTRGNQSAGSIFSD